jgi:membrane protein implicated in regulation of membrane protease activity
MTTRTRYFLLQLPSWMLAAAVLAAFHRWAGLPLWAALLAWAVYAAKDVALYPKLKGAYESSGPDGAQALVGQIGVVKQALQPEGYVHVAGELWQARASAGEPMIPVGTRVRVVEGAGLVLTVRSETGLETGRGR